MENSFSLQLSTNEALALTAALAGDTWMGLPQLGNISAVEMQALAHRGAQSLADRGLLSTDSSGGYRLQSGLMRLAQAILKPWVILALHQSDNPELRWLFVTPNISVEQRVEQSTLCLTAFERLESLQNRALKFLKLDVEKSLVGQEPAFELDLDLMNGLKSEEPDGITQLLEKNVVPVEVRQPIADMMMGKRSLSAVQIFDSIVPGRIVDHILWLDTQSGNWQVQPGANGKLSFTPVGGEELRTVIRGMIACQ